MKMQGKKGKRFLAFFLLSLILLSVGGCIRPRSVERFGYVLAMGVDRGTQLPYHITLMLQKAENSSGESKGSGFALIGAECTSLFEAAETLTANLPFLLDFSRTVMVVLSDELLKADAAVLAGFGEGTFEDLRMRSGMHLLVSLGKAKDALEGLNSDFSLNVARIQQKLASYSKESGLIPIASAAQLQEAIHFKTFDCAIPLIGVGQQDTQRIDDSTEEQSYAYIGGRMPVEGGMEAGIMGSALLSGTRFCGVLDGQNTQLLLMGAGAFSSGRMTFFMEDGKPFVVRLEKRRRIHRELTVEGMPKARLEIPLRGRVELGKTDILSEEEMAQWLSNKLEQEIQKLFSTLQGLDCDAMGFGKLAVMKCYSAEEWEKMNWRTAYQNLKADFSVSLVLED